MSLYIVDIHGELEGDYEIIKKYEEPKTGHWITETAKHNRHLGSRNGYCSVCKNFYTDDWDIMNFCPNCGAKMAESEEA